MATSTAFSSKSTTTTLARAVTSEPSTKPKTPTAQESESRLGGPRREAAERAEQRIHEGATKATSLVIDDTDTEDEEQETVRPSGSSQQA